MRLTATIVEGAGLEPRRFLTGVLRFQSLRDGLVVLLAGHEVPLLGEGAAFGQGASSFLEGRLDEGRACQGGSGR
jgi:hypothetical protein